MSDAQLSRYGATRSEIEALLDGWGEPTYRAGQLWEGLYPEARPLADVTTLPRTLRARLDDALPLALELVTEATAADDMTTKWLWACTRDGAQIETVLMRYPTRATVCVSSQAGCAMGCTFCATGQAGFERHLDPAEIVEQVQRAAQASPQRVRNVVFMGMGEPLANYEATWAAIERLHDDVGISARRITVSTVGVVPGIRRLALERLPVTLAVSLHAATDDRRSELVPLNRRYPIAEVLDAAAEYAGARDAGSPSSTPASPGSTTRWRRPRRSGASWAAFRAPAAHVNLIPLNPTAGFGGEATATPRLRAFAERLRARGITATVRRNRGTDIAAACGQLRARDAIPRRALGSVTMAT